MRKVLIISILCFLPLASGSAASITNLYTGQSISTGTVLTSVASSIGGTNATPDLIHEDFETGSIPANWEDLGSGTIWNYTPALLGTYSVACPPNALAAYLDVDLDKSEIYSYFEVNLGQLPTTGNHSEFYAVFDSSDNVLASAWVSSTGALNLECLGDNFGWSGTMPTASTTASLATNTVYYVWAHYKAGTGLNAVFSASFSTTNSEPTNGTYFASVPLATATANASSVVFESYPGPGTNVFDHVGVATFDMPTGW